MDIKSKPIDLPSEGYFYPENHPLSDGTIEIRHMTAADEDILTDEQLIQKGEAIDKLLENVIVEEGIDLDDVLNGDVGGIMLATRILAYGPQYAYEAECPVCGEQNQKSTDLGEIQNKDVPFDEFEPHQTEFEMALPVTDAHVTFRLLTRGDSQRINKELDRVKRQAGRKKKGKRKAGSQTSTNMTTRLRYLINSVNGNEDVKEIREFVEQMPARDSLALRREVSRINPDLDLEHEFICDFCGHSEFMNIPLDETFFFPTE
jgi:hypothetical protein